MQILLLISAIVTIVVGVPTDMERASREVDVEPPSLNNIKKSIPYKLVTRKEWGARKPKQILPLGVPVPYVVIHHSFIPPACYDEDQCSYAMRTMQSMHVDDESRKWWDIGYNFGVGSEGSVYEGRGWDILGAHSLKFNNVSLGICLIGNWNDTLPPEIQLQTAKALIDDGVSRGYISPDYKLVGHRQVRPTECPGQALYELIRTWPHYDFKLNLAANFKDYLNNVDVKTDRSVGKNRL